MLGGACGEGEDPMKSNLCVVRGIFLCLVYFQNYCNFAYDLPQTGSVAVIVV